MVGFARYPQLEPNSKPMKKTKLTLFVAVLAVALFGMGCASTPKPDVANAVKWNGHWYAFIIDPVSWEEANKRCIELGGHLAIIDSEEENEFVWNLAEGQQTGQGNMWLGATDSKTNSDVRADRSFRWLSPNGKKLSLTYNKWIKGAFKDPFKSNDQGFVYMYLRSSNKGWAKTWYFRSNAETVNPFMCEWE